MSTPEPLNIAARSLAPAFDSRRENLALRVFDHDLAERHVSYGALADRALRVAGGLCAAGVGAGDRVMVRLPSGLGYAAAALGTFAAGAVLVPSTDRLTAAEAGFLIDDARVCAVLTRPGIVAPAASTAPGMLDVDVLIDRSAPAERFAATSAEDPALLIYTSGTSSDPKGVLHAHRMVRGREPMRDGWTGVSADDTVLHAGKLNWTYTLGLVLMDTLSTGATAVLYDGRNDPHIWPELVRRTSATIFAAVPTVYRQILKYDVDLRESLASLRHGLTAGEPLREEVLESWRARVGTELFEALGMSECSTYVSSGPATPVRPGSPGRPQPGRRVALLPIDGEPVPLRQGETGLLAVHRSDPGLMLGYWERPNEESAVFRGDWFVGGDLARMDEDGYVWFAGRNDELMNAFGYRVSPLEVERALSTMPGIRECAVAERRVRDDVSVICAYVVPGAPSPERDEILAWCQTRLADYKQPREVVFTNHLPRGSNGKLERRRLQDIA